MPQPIKEEDLKIITKKVYALYAKHGFDGISMDELSAQTNISKATLYRYFTSKEDIVQSMVDFLITHLDSLQFDRIEDISDVVNGSRKIYMKSIIIAALTGSEFLINLKKKFPEAYTAYTTSFNAMQERSAAFFRQAVEMGFCKDLPFAFVSKQFGGMIPTVINMDFLERSQMTLPEAIREYYRMFLYQNLHENYLSITKEESTYEFVPDLAGVLKDDFFIDSIRR